MKKLSECFSGLLSYWGGDTPPEAIWAANDFLDFHKPFYKELEGLSFIEDDVNGENEKIIELLKSMGI